MTQVKIYQYKQCSTCRKAIKYLEANDIPFESIAIVETPPTKVELKQALKDFGGEVKKLFNTSGLVYREMKLSQKIKTMSEQEAIDLLNANGKLVKRPFVLSEAGTLVGFKEECWDEVFKK